MALGRQGEYWQSYLTFVTWTLPLGCGRATPGTRHLPVPALGLSAHEEHQISVNRKIVGKMVRAYCAAPRGSRGDEGQLATAPGQGLGVAAGRKRDKITVFNLIRHRLRWPGELPGLPSPQHSASPRRLLASGMTASRARSSAQAESGSVSAFSARSLTRGKRRWGKGNDLVCDGAQPGTRSSAQEHRELPRGKRQELHTAAVSALQPLPQQSHGLDRTVSSCLGSSEPLERFPCSFSRARLTANVSA